MTSQEDLLKSEQPEKLNISLHDHSLDRSCSTMPFFLLSPGTFHARDRSYVSVTRAQPLRPLHRPTCYQQHHVEVNVIIRRRRVQFSVYICVLCVCIVTNMESRFPAMQILWLGREFYKVKHGGPATKLCHH
ncbi:hypothetical protein AVEN_78108-1 [Araneus ventricosus]|uniref:Uncharacterized protein n=1 Tax=Araneus ventricosus TaxID=182803 RepID=A0A4Y2F8P2_ARAVE|nr:hypothetical protein AVEN_78108-1 [Araneus ventricosus]